MNIEDVRQIATKFGFEKLHTTDKLSEWRRKSNNQCIYIYFKKKTTEINLDAIVIHPDHSIEDIISLPNVRLTSIPEDTTAWNTEDIYKHGSNMRYFPKRLNKGKKPIQFGIQLTAHGVNGLENIFKFVANEKDDASAEEKLLHEVAKIESSTDLSDTDKEALIKVRLGQGVFKKRVAAIEKSCRVTGVDDVRFLIASHILPWSKCETDAQRLDGNNGLLLSPHIDKLFDNGYISFADDGSILVSDQCPGPILEKWKVDFERNVKPLTAQQAKYMKFHREIYGF